MKRLLTLVSLLLVVAITATAQPKYIFLFIGDGLGINHVYGTELYNAAVHPDMPNGGLMSFSRFPIRTYVTNHSSSTLVTDSSAAATALASGVKTVNGYMGVDAEKSFLQHGLTGTGAACNDTDSVCKCCLYSFSLLGSQTNLQAHFLTVQFCIQIIVSVLFWMVKLVFDKVSKSFFCPCGFRPIYAVAIGEHSAVANELVCAIRDHLARELRRIKNFATSLNKSFLFHTQMASAFRFG